MNISLDRQHIPNHGMINYDLRAILTANTFLYFTIKIQFPNILMLLKCVYVGFGNGTDGEIE